MNYERGLSKNMDLHYFSNLWTIMEGSKNRKNKKPQEEYPTLFFLFFPFFSTLFHSFDSLWQPPLCFLPFLYPPLLPTLCTFILRLFIAQKVCEPHGIKRVVSLGNRVIVGSVLHTCRGLDVLEK